MQNLNINNYNIDFSKVNWKPNKFGGSQFNISNFQYENDVLRILPSKSAKIIPLVVTIVFGSLPFIFYSINNKKPDTVVLFVVGVFVLIFLISYIGLMKKVEINKPLGSVKKGYNLKNAKLFCNLSEVLFIQVVEQLIPQKRNNYFSYEINIVCKDNNRITLTDHADFDYIKKEAQKLKLFLGLPIFTKSKKTSEIIELS